MLFYKCIHISQLIMFNIKELPKTKMMGKIRQFFPCTFIHTVKKSSIIECYLLVSTLSGKVSDRLVTTSCIDLV